MEEQKQLEIDLNQHNHMKHDWNKVFDNPPNEVYQPITTHDLNWLQQLTEFVRKRKPITINIHDMPVYPEIIEVQLSSGAYLEYIPPSDNWQRFLVPKDRG